MSGTKSSNNGAALDLGKVAPRLHDSSRTNIPKQSNGKRNVKSPQPQDVPVVASRPAEQALNSRPAAALSGVPQQQQRAPNVESSSEESQYKTVVNNNNLGYPYPQLYSQPPYYQQEPASPGSNTGGYDYQYITQPYAPAPYGPPSGSQPSPYHPIPSAVGYAPMSPYGQTQSPTDLPNNNVNIPSAAQQSSHYPYFAGGGGYGNLSVPELSSVEHNMAWYDSSRPSHQQMMSGSGATIGIGQYNTNPRHPRHYDSNSKAGIMPSQPAPPGSDEAAADVFGREYMSSFPSHHHWPTYPPDNMYAAGWYGEVHHHGNFYGDPRYSHPFSPGPPIQAPGYGKGPDGANLFIFHIPNNFTNQLLYDLFKPHGNLLSVRIMVEAGTGRSRGFGFVSYDTPDSAAKAIKALNGYSIGNKRLKVQHKQIRKDSLTHEKSIQESRSGETESITGDSSDHRHTEEDDHYQDKDDNTGDGSDDSEESSDKHSETSSSNIDMSPLGKSLPDIKAA